MSIFRICTIVNEMAQYEAMRDTFIAEGFNNTNSVFQWFDNIGANRHEPYSTFAKVLAQANEPYIVFCHQDVRLDKGHGFAHLLSIVNDMNESEPNWAVLGNAGMTTGFEYILRVSDPYGKHHYEQLPQRVVSLDENFLLVRAQSRICFSSDLTGFHFYAADLCLNALRGSRSCHVVDFHLTHLSTGNQGRDFLRSKKRFAAYWGKQFRFMYFPTVCTNVLLTRYLVLRWFFRWNKVFKILRKRHQNKMDQALVRIDPALTSLPKTHYKS